MNRISEVSLTTPGRGREGDSSMACDVRLELLGPELVQLVRETVPGETSLEDLLVRAAKRCGISPRARSLLAFKQVDLFFLNSFKAWLDLFPPVSLVKSPGFVPPSPVG